MGRLEGFRSPKTFMLQYTPPSPLAATAELLPSLPLSSLFGVQRGPLVLLELFLEGPVYCMIGTFSGFISGWDTSGLQVSFPLQREPGVPGRLRFCGVS